MDERRNLFFYYANDEQISSQLETLFRIAEEQKFKIVDHFQDANIIISIGGDGAFLQAVRKSGFRQDCLYMGIKTKNEAGLYCDFVMDDFNEMVHIMLNEELEVRRFPVISVRINNMDKKFYCLNEVSIRSSIIKSFILDVYIDNNHFESFSGDGLIISTPTGSTGYNKSANGAVVDPLLPCYQVTELASLNNNRFRTLGSPFVLSGQRKLTLKITKDGNHFPIIGLDNEALSIRNIQSVHVELSDKVIKTVKLKNNSFWDRVKRTFL
jgi:NAD+ kinase